MTILDAVVAGYGPTGATVANLLGRRGWRVRVVEPSTGIYGKPRAITADHEAMRVFQSLGLAAEIEPATIPHPGTDFLGLRGQVIKRFYPATPPRMLGWEPTFMFFQPQLESTLRAGVDRLPDVTVDLGRELVSFDPHPKSVDVTVRDVGTTREHLVSARYLVACDGARSTVRNLLGAAVEDLAFDEWWVIVDTFLTGEPELPERLTHYCRPDRPGTYIVGPGRLRRWELKILPGEDPQEFTDTGRIREVLRGLVDTDQLEIARIAVYRFHALVAEQWRHHGRIFLAGDAAHQMPPFLGQGMGAGVRDAWNLAWKLDAVRGGRATDDLLDTYTAERKPHVRAVVGHAESFGRIIGELDAERCRLRDARLERELAAGAETVRQRFVPGLTDGLLARDPGGTLAPAAGELFPQPRVADLAAAGPPVLLDEHLGPDFATVVLDKNRVPPEVVPNDRPWPGSRVVVVHEAGSAAPEPPSRPEVRHVRAMTSLLTDWARERGIAAVVVRPDRYVYGAAADAPGLDRLLLELSERLGSTAAVTR